MGMTTDKKQIRDKCISIRLAMAAAEVRQKSMAIISAFIDSGLYASNDVFHLYYPINNEVDLIGLMDRIWMDGKLLMMPRTDFSRREIINYFVTSTEELEKTRFSMMEPDPLRCRAADIPPDVILVPGVAFSRLNARLGYGGGFYDRFLADSSALKIGVAFSCQILPELPVEAHDVLMDAIITENGMLS